MMYISEKQLTQMGVHVEYPKTYGVLVHRTRGRWLVNTTVRYVEVLKDDLREGGGFLIKADFPALYRYITENYPEELI